MTTPKQTVCPKFLGCEMETHINIDYADNLLHMDTSIMKHYNKAKKQHWTLIENYVDSTGKVIGGKFTAPAEAITMRSVTKDGAPKKEMTDEQRAAASARMKAIHKNKKQKGADK